MSYTNWDNLKPKACKRCGREFQPNTPRRQYCSEACRRGSGTCKVCGKTFVRKGNTTGEYCSPECWYKSGDAKSYTGRECPNCHKIFTGKTKSQRFCCVTCGVEYRTIHNDRRCKTCGKPLPNGKRYKAVYCSTECRRAGFARYWDSRSRPVGSKRTTKDGYIVLKVSANQWRREHQLIMERHLARPLAKNEHVHHINGDRADNRIENLELWQGSHPYGVRKLDSIKDTIMRLSIEQRKQLCKWLQEQV